MSKCREANPIACSHKFSVQDFKIFENNDGDVVVGTKIPSQYQANEFWEGLVKPFPKLWDMSIRGDPSKETKCEIADATKEAAVETEKVECRYTGWREGFFEW